jgi:HK97 family phage prohead protease
MNQANRANLLNVPETRAACPFEYREDAASGKIIVEGYAATFDPYEVYGGPDKGGWTEQLQRTAFDVTLASKPDLVLLINHEGYPLARTTTDTLQLCRDRHGLKIRAQLDPTDPDVQRLMPKLKPQANGKSNMDEMSFGFRVKDQMWDNSYTHRTITELSLHHGDVSIVNYGANSNTHVAVSDTIDALAQLSRDDLLEVRSAVDDNLARVRFSAPTPGVVRTEQPDIEVPVKPTGPEAFESPHDDTVSVGDIDATIQAIRDAADPEGLRSLSKRLAEFSAVSLPPTLAP